MKKVLIIEDDSMIADLYKLVFTKHNYAVEVAYNGEDGLDKVTVLNPDIILVDVMMPKMNGMRVIERLKGDPQSTKIPVIVLSNLSDPTTEQAMLQAGAMKFVVKSQTLPDEIVTIVDEYFTHE